MKAALGQRHYDSAVPLHSEPKDIAEAALREPHPSYANLARLYEAVGACEAEPLYLEARDIRKAALGGQHPDYAESLISSAA